MDAYILWLLIGVMGIFFLTEGKRRLNFYWITIGSLMLIFPMFTYSRIQDVAIASFALAFAYQKR